MSEQASQPNDSDRGDIEQDMLINQDDPKRLLRLSDNENKRGRTISN